MKIARVHPFLCTPIFLTVLACLGLALPALGEESYTFVARWGQSGEAPLNHPLYIVVDSAGYAYLVDYPYSGQTKPIKKFKSDGSQFFYSRDAEPIPIFHRDAIAIDAWGYLQAMDSQDHSRVVVFEKDTGDTIGWFGACDSDEHAGSGHWHTANTTHLPTRGSGPGQLANQTSVAADSLGRTYVCDNGNHRIVVLELAKDADGSMCLNYVGWFGGCDHIADHVGNDRMHGRDSTHKPQSGDGDGFITYPSQIAVSGDGRLYITDQGGAPYMHLFRTNGQFVRSWGSDVISEMPWGITVDGGGNVYVTYGSACWVGKYTTDMGLICRWGSPGRGDGEFQWPFGVSVDASGRVFIADPGFPCVNIFAPANRPPTANAGPDQTVECACRQGGTQVTLNGTGSSDPDGNPLTYTWTGPFVGSPSSSNPTVKLLPGCRGAYEVTLVVSDGQLNSQPDTMQVTVRDTTAPSLTCPASMTVEAKSASGVPATDPAIVAFLAGASASDNCDPSPVVSNNAPSQFPIDETPVTFTATDASSNRSTCEVTVKVQDTTPPTIASVSASPNVLWPANHKMVAVVVRVNAKDLCDPSPKSRIVDVTCNEAVNGPGDGNTTPDWQITSDLTVMLRAERSGSGDGRIYTIHVECTDKWGNTSTPSTVEVTVPHDQGKKK